MQSLQSQTNAFSNVRVLRDTFTGSLIGTAVPLADPGSSCHLPPLAMGHALPP